jgi:prepilin-type N-terminal cleavage/methylation domain-containing protein
MGANGCKGRVFQTRGFSLVELLVVIAVIGVVAMVAVPNIANVRAAAQDSNVQSQEKQLNNIYRSLKSSSTNMPSGKEEILDYLANDPRAKIVPPETLESSQGTLTLTFDSEKDLFTYGLVDVAGGVEEPTGGSAEPTGDNEEPPTGIAGWNPPVGGVSSDETTNFSVYNGATSYPEAWFRNNQAVAIGSEEYFQPSAGGYPFEPFKVSVAADGSATLTSQSGQTYAMEVNPNDRSGNDQVGFAVETPDGAIYWKKRPDGSIKVGSIVSSVANL